MFLYDESESSDSELLIRKSAVLVRGVVVNGNQCFLHFHVGIEYFESLYLQPREKIWSNIMKAWNMFSIEMNVEFKRCYHKASH